MSVSAAFDESIDRLDWMGPETRAQAHDKLHKMRVKIGYPEKWRDYSALEVRAAVGDAGDGHGVVLSAAGRFGEAGRFIGVMEDGA